ncbi:MAG: hypothetical protein M0D57_03720 [Sphingobacteriales bacterium JAD_PAG50586_3]|nr:MAG: hypothetical protein M0D57_03720 [Sphingobacteriales bacterium JAD_PAG50586_3]
MKLRTLLYLLLMAVLNAKAQVPNVAIDAKWNLIFEDEFNGTAVNTSVWKIPFFYFESEDSSCIYDNTIRAYRSENLPNDNVIVDNGILTLTVDSLHTPVTANIHCNYDTLWPSFDTTVTFTTGVLQSIDTFQFGYYEIKFRIPGAGRRRKNILSIWP